MARDNAGSKGFSDTMKSASAPQIKISKNLILSITVNLTSIWSYSFLLGTSSQQVRCLENGRFYRDPDRPAHILWTGSECSKYFLCLEGEVFEFRCSTGLLFDINRQICDFKLNVNNCDVTEGTTVSRTLLNRANCTGKAQLGCADGTCLPEEYFCDGAIDCADGSDERYCDLHQDPNVALPCNTTACQLPNCFCSNDGTDIPGELYPTEVPQMIILTFDDAITNKNWHLYKRLFNSKRKNPNRCPIKATFFVSHQFNNYYHTQQLWNDGHEIAIHSITHRGPEDWWSYNATIEDWFDEMIGQANILNRFAKIRMADIRGLRVPFLRVGWNRQFLMMKEFGFLYDSSIVAPFSNPPFWPYTLDHKIPHFCMGNRQKCPSRAHPGIWEMVINQQLAKDYTCAMIDSCVANFSTEETYKMLIYNFKRHYLSNRAPYGLYFHSTWFEDTRYLQAFEGFLDEILKHPDVWFVTNWQAIEWMKQPTPIEEINSFQPWKCNKQFASSEKVCPSPNTCKLSNHILKEDRYLYTCSKCPKSYPWIRNEFGFK